MNLDRPSRRLNGKVTNKFGEELTVGVSVPLDATSDEKNRILASIQAAVDETAEFNRLPREKQLEHYLNIAVQALYKIMNSSTTHASDMTGELWQHDQFKDKFFQLSGICATADMALIQIPTNVRGEIDRNARINA